MASVSGVARRIIAADGGNILDDYYSFYHEGEWIINVARKVSSTLAAMKESIVAYVANIPKLEECAGYISSSKGADIGTESCAKELKAKIADIKKKYSEWEKAEPSEQARIYDEYKALVVVLKDYMDAFVESGVNIFRNRYVEDEENVRNLLDVIHSTGNAVLNKNAGTGN